MHWETAQYWWDRKWNWPNTVLNLSKATARKFEIFCPHHIRPTYSKTNLEHWSNHGMARNVNVLFVNCTHNQYIFSSFSYVCLYVCMYAVYILVFLICMYACLYTHACIRMHRYIHMHTYKCSASWEIMYDLWISSTFSDYPTFFYVLWRSLCRYHVYFTRWYVLCIHKPRLKHDVLLYVYIYVYMYIFHYMMCRYVFIKESDNSCII